MMRPAAPGYNERVIGVWGRGAVSALFVSLCFLFLAGPARADESYAVGPSPIVRVIDEHRQGDDRDLGQPAGHRLDQRLGRRAASRAERPRRPASAGHPDRGSRPSRAQQGTIALVRENFVLPHLPAGPHDAIVVRGQGDTTITIPRGTALVFAHVRGGRITIQNYNGVFVAHSRGGAIVLQHVGGTGFAQSLRGSVTVDDSSFARLRVRTGTGNMLFRNCVAHQIEASSTYGSIVYDNGQFQPGLARFESQYGNVAVGVQNQGNGVQIGAHSGSGHIVSNYSDGTQVTGGDVDTEARVRGGGPVVTTSSQTGSVYLYNGSMAAHPAVQQNLEPSIGGTMRGGRRRAAAPRDRRTAPAAQFRRVSGSAAAGVRVQQQPRAFAPVQHYPVHYPVNYPVRYPGAQPYPQPYPHQPRRASSSSARIRNRRRRTNNTRRTSESPRPPE